MYVYMYRFYNFCLLLFKTCIICPDGKKVVCRSSAKKKKQKVRNLNEIV